MEVENFEKLPEGNLKNYLLADCLLSSSPKGVLYFRPYSSLDFLELATASPAKICLDYERNYSIKYLDILLVE